jgi:RNA polymerase subunit RPABC4/transcription elongation factor Spt4
MLRPCHRCLRHHRDETCPFCQASQASLVRAGGVVVAFALAACTTAPKVDAVVDGSSPRPLETSVPVAPYGVPPYEAPLTVQPSAIPTVSASAVPSTVPATARPTIPTAKPPVPPKPHDPIHERHVPLYGAPF